ncbi:MAG: VWA domain-containing protein [Lentisphaeria bacterium]|nr:VWA domain-containing protein [Lentisphaeria bacterium]
MRTPDVINGLAPARSRAGGERPAMPSLTGKPEAVAPVRVRREMADAFLALGQATPEREAAPARRLAEDVTEDQAPNREAYDHIRDNPFRNVADEPLSTFSIDVDTASYSNLRRFLSNGQRPPPDAVRIEELVNYFRYDYPPPRDGKAFAVHADTASCPWKPAHRLVRIGLKGRVPEPGARPPANLVFLVDVSGSMRPPDKLPLLVQGMKMLVNQLGESDRVAMAVYAGASGLVLPSTPAGNRGEILAALDRLQAGGSTNGGAGIELAYRVATENRVEGGINRVILATDGDFNVGVTDRGSLTRMIEEKARTGVFLTVLGFGTGNIQDATMEQLADRGNGAYAYIDSEREARKVLVEQVGATLHTIAKDVKIQVEFNPTRVTAYRLIGYENRILANQDFHDDTKDAGEIGAGHTVTAFYEVVPAGTEPPAGIAGVDGLRYQTPRTITAAAAGNELLTVKLRHKQPDADTSELQEIPVPDDSRSWESTPDDFQFASAVALFGMVLRHSPYAGEAGLDMVLELAAPAARHDPHGNRTEFLELVRKAKTLVQR